MNPKGLLDQPFEDTGSPSAGPLENGTIGINENYRHKILSDPFGPRTENKTSAPGKVCDPVAYSQGGAECPETGKGWKSGFRISLPVEGSPVANIGEHINKAAAPKGKGPPPGAMPGAREPAAKKVGGTLSHEPGTPGESWGPGDDPLVAMPADYESALVEIARLRRIAEQQRKVINGFNLAVFGQGGADGPQTGQVLLSV